MILFFVIPEFGEFFENPISHLGMVFSFSEM